MDRSRFVKEFSEEISAGNAAIFAGAGLSVPAGFVNWRDLLRDIAEELELDIDKEHDLVSVAQYHLNRNAQQRGKLNKAIIESLSLGARPTNVHKILCRLPIEIWWTTNYDELIEQSLRNENKIVDVKYTVEQLAYTKPYKEVTVYKMHGDVNHPNQAVISRDDYEKYLKTRGAFINALAGDLVSRTFLFIGFGFSDPNLSKVLSHIRVNFSENQRPHYAIFRREKRSDYKKLNEFTYQSIKQNLFIEDLKNYNINSILVDEYSEIYDIINELHGKITQKNIFVSTAADNFEPWGEHAVQEFMRKLGKLLISRGFRIVSGVGLGTGNALISGAIQEIVQSSKKIDQELIMRPFPLFIEDNNEREKAWSAYRLDMISRCGIAIFLFGNKLTKAGIVHSTGMIEEFRIAMDCNIIAIPIGATGSAAEQLAKDYPKNLYLYEKVKLLSESKANLNELIGPILDIIDDVKN